ncbi:hypothetical protein [Fusibacter ferrireducens]|uniref:Uncharacterized protein n=1 Tax=Fusibacter ferrireducens TaxID=2785058 RepID=A0ABS0A099_9FIRM|nr:hypothetical protein [Fusibacter ferrireducens]MBF4695656.1 hypothetical protein [Fusibacter ferrireducens]
MKKCFGLIVNRLDDKVTLIDFLLNAKQFGHTIDEVIIIYSQDIDRGYLENIRTFVKVKLIHVNRLDRIYDALHGMGISEKAIVKILGMGDFEETGLVTYSKKRNLVLLQALLDDMDIVYFIDSDVHPCVLYAEGKCEEIDFVGVHLNHLLFKNVAATTSDYSGYFILPPMKFNHMEAFLTGIQKEGAIAYMNTSDLHNCLKLGIHEHYRTPTFTNKLLGGNLAMRTGFLNRIPPFFSFFYKVADQYYLTRGEDTTMGVFFDQNHLKVIDIDVKITHDTFGTYPKRPDLLNDPLIKNRLFYASMGWIGRNPFLNYILGKDVQAIADAQKKEMIVGAEALAHYTNDSRFLMLPQAIDSAVANLPAMIERYEEVKSAWFEITKTIERRKG